MRAAALVSTIVLTTAAGAAEVPDGWWSRVQRDIAASEYHLTWQPGAQEFQAPNRAQRLRATFGSSGLRVSPREEAERSAWEWGLVLTGWGRPGTLLSAAEAAPSASGARAEYDRGSVREWYLNEPRGIEQGFTLSAPPGDPGTVVHLELALTGTLSPVVSEDGQAIDFATPQGRKVLHYATLVVTDAAGRPLRAWMEGIPGGIRIALEDESAVYPVTVDPLATSPAWSNTGTGVYGYAVDTAGDVNGDGISDMVVGAYDFSNGGTAGSGRVYVYHGSPSGPSLAPSSVLVNPLMGASTRFGWDVGTAGDVNGDGYADLVVTTQSDQPGVNSSASLYVGSASGIATTPVWTVDTGDNYSAAETAGDVNGDGFSDVIVGCPFDAPEARVFHGSASGLPTTWNWSATGPLGDALGISVGTAGDVNGDGYADVVVGAPQAHNGTSFAGKAYVYHGSASGLAANPSWTVAGTQASENFGWAVGTAGDTNGDGYADVIVGARNHSNGQTGEGRAFVYLGSSGGLSTSATWSPESNLAGARYGEAVGTAGDINGDGYADIVVGAPWLTFPLQFQGRAYVYLGTASGPLAVPDWTVDGPQAQTHYGISLGTAGDVNGDGYADVIVGSESNLAQMFLGSPSGPHTSPGWTRESDQAGAQLGTSVATAGDVDGDGFADVIVGAPLYDNGQTDEGRAFLFAGSATGLATVASWTAESNQAGARFGTSVGTAGDVDGDGYADVVVGAPLYDNVEVDEGRAFVYLGSPTGLAAVASWTAESDQTNARLGTTVGTAGDVNGDGFSDVLAAAPRYDNGQTDEGRALLYLGSTTGLSTTPLWTVESDQAGAQLGTSLGSAGDVNRDGYSDVVVGASFYDNGQTDEGRAFLYLGSASGPATTPAWTAESNLAGAQLGWSAGTAGDVNGDGYADVVLGAPFYDNGQTHEGRAYVYHGSASPPYLTAAWTAESNSTEAYFGWSVATAGDVNGDGYADVVVGAPLYSISVTEGGGQAYVYLGSASGLALNPGWSVIRSLANSEFGWSVGTAGDVNGDGYADLVVGTPLDDNGQTNEGVASVYYGNGGRGVALRPQQRRTMGSTLVPRLGASDSPDTFLAGLLGRSPFGRGKVRLEWEVKPLGASLDGTGTQVGPNAFDTGTAGFALDEPVLGLSASTRYHWRVRLRYEAATTPFAQRSRWITIPWGGWNEAMLRTGAAPVLAAGNVPSLVMAKAGTQVTLSWAASCAATDTDYEVYEGTLGTFYSHSPRACSTSGATSHTLAPQAGNRYFLVVPHNVGREGSYGLTSAGAERPQGTPICRVREAQACP